MTAENCSKCGGKGRAGPCSYCSGAGGRTVTEGGTQTWEDCGACGGTGTGTCDRCAGSGTVYVASIPSTESLSAPRHQDRGPSHFQLAGVWLSKIQTNRGVLITELILDPSNKFCQKTTYNDHRISDVGIYHADSGCIDFFVEDHEPKVYHGRPMSWLRCWTCFFTVVDGNTMLFENRSTKHRWSVHRQLEASARGTV
jgi:hypothetical protein